MLLQKTNLIVVLLFLTLLGCESKSKNQLSDRFFDSQRFAGVSLSKFDLLFENGTSFSVTNQNELDSLYKELCNPKLPFLAPNEKGKWYYMDYCCLFSDKVSISYAAAVKFNQQGTYLQLYFQEDDAFMGDPSIYIKLDDILRDSKLVSLKKHLNIKQ